ncbi:Glyoxalase/Bleomycin resistance protein/Dihydroxybiphenyl dioxygenase [Fusarium redolens]|uniref:Aldoketomutase n=1 Tax=Fusarium redolens TaxID=48865 RepID=A0A9P9GBQ2_FUSRE|nr:Glyoxalase/Bleomycin resistance protein/Dihydroxybiphenyl dioxygenase [Fusarium redolens]KAH7234802.1 Glyoxalase/Bleomycin resistance protein/Dihydroxybiphenyl dioxygenase [Fusarium redolens]
MERRTDTRTYKLNHAMIRVKDPKRTIQFYELLGLSVIQKLSFPENKFDLYFLGVDSPGSSSHGKFTFDRQGLIELTHNYGTEHDEDYRVNNGNEKPHLGFSHISISVPDVQATYQTLAKAGYKFEQDASFRNDPVIALDPDGYWVQITEQGPSNKSSASNAPAPSSVNQYALRVTDAARSIRYYTENLGMKLVKTIASDDGNSKTFLLGYPSTGPFTGTEDLSRREGLLALIWQGGENGISQVHNGNDQPQGFGHTCVTVDDIYAACARLEGLNVAWKKRLTDGKMKNVAFLLDPDNYWIELVQNEGFTGKANF